MEGLVIEPQEARETRFARERRDFGPRNGGFRRILSLEGSFGGRWCCWKENFACPVKVVTKDSCSRWCHQWSIALFELLFSGFEPENSPAKQENGAKWGELGLGQVRARDAEPQLRSAQGLQGASAGDAASARGGAREGAGARPTAEVGEGALQGARRAASTGALGRI